MNQPNQQQMSEMVKKAVEDINQKTQELKIVHANLFAKHLEKKYGKMSGLDRDTLLEEKVEWLLEKVAQMDVTLIGAVTSMGHALRDRSVKPE